MGLSLTEDEFHDPELVKSIFGTGIECARSGDEICLTEEVYILQVVTLHQDQTGQIHFKAVENPDDNDYLYEPRFFDWIKWENTVDDVKALKEDERVPILNDSVYGIYKCDYCCSHIVEGDFTGMAAHGEIRNSKRTPNKEGTHVWAQLDTKPQFFCISCLKLINDEVTTLWDQGVDQQGECDQGTHYRCWRYGCPDDCDFKG